MRLERPAWIDAKLFERSWRNASEQNRGTPLEGYYQNPPQSTDGLLQELPIVALDFESDGLGKDAALLEAGWVEMTQSAIKLSTAKRKRIKANEALQESAVVIHRITDNAAADGYLEADVLAKLLDVVSGKVILAHAAQIEAAFLNAACLRQYHAPFVGRFICTMQLEERWFPKQRTADGLRLGKLRSQYGLPSYRAHDGLTDAIACGELFLAQCARKGRDDLSLGDVLMRG